MSGYADDLTIAMVQSVNEGRGRWCIDKRVYKVDSERSVAAGLGEFALKMMDFALKMKTFCIKNDEFCI